MSQSECPFCGTPFCTDEGQDNTPYLLDCGHSLCRKCCARLRSLACPRYRSTDSFDVDGPVFSVTCPSCHKSAVATDENGRLRMDYVTAAYISCFGSQSKPAPFASSDAAVDGAPSATIAQSGKREEEFIMEPLSDDPFGLKAKENPEKPSEPTDSAASMFPPVPSRPLNSTDLTAAAVKPEKPLEKTGPATMFPEIPSRPPATTLAETSSSSAAEVKPTSSSVTSEPVNSSSDLMSPAIPSRPAIVPNPTSSSESTAAEMKLPPGGTGPTFIFPAVPTRPPTSTSAAAAASEPAAVTKTEKQLSSPPVPERAKRQVPQQPPPPRPAKLNSEMICARHEAERKLYCQTCQTLCCPLCAAAGGDHFHHALVVREAAQKELVDTLRQNIAKLQEALPVEILEKLQQVIKRLGEAKDRVGEESERGANDAKDELDKRKEVLLESLDGQIDSLVGGLQAQADLMKESSAKAEKLIERSNAYLVCMEANVAKVPEIVKLVWALYHLRPELQQLSVQYIPTETKLSFKVDGNMLMNELKQYGYFTHNPPPPQPAEVAKPSSPAASVAAAAAAPRPQQLQQQPQQQQVRPIQQQQRQQQILPVQQQPAPPVRPQELQDQQRLQLRLQQQQSQQQQTPPPRPPPPQQQPQQPRPQQPQVPMQQQYGPPPPYSRQPQQQPYMYGYNYPGPYGVILPQQPVPPPQPARPVNPYSPYASPYSAQSPYGMSPYYAPPPPPPQQQQQVQAQPGMPAYMEPMRINTPGDLVRAVRRY